MPRPQGVSVRLRLTLSYAGFLLVAGFLLLSLVWVFLLRYVPDGAIEAARFVPNRSDLLRAFAPRAAWAMVFLVAFGLVGGWFLAGRMLAPLIRIGDAARLAGEGSLSHRIRMEGGDDEFRRLADVFDTMLDRLEAHVAEQERFAANASHELRTPLAITQTMLEVARKDPDRDVDLLLQRLQAVNTRAIELADALLLLHRTSRAPVPGTDGSVDLSLVAEEAAENLLPLAERRGVTLEVTGDAARCRGSEPLLLQLTTNLVHNAIVHNLPAGGTVTVTATALPDAAVLRVENTGPDLDAADIPALLEPFQRGRGRAVAADHAGTGLGLAIAQNIVTAHRGELRLLPRAGGGAAVTVRLPV